MKFKWNWKQNSNVIENKIIENKIRMKLKTKLLETKFKWIWKQNSNEFKNEIQTNLKIKFKWNWKQNSNKFENEIRKEIQFQTKFKQLAACTPKQALVYGSGWLKQPTLKMIFHLW
jgi:hypothetical protein